MRYRSRALTYNASEADIVDLSKLSTSDRLILGGGIAYLIFMFFPWYGIDTGIGSLNNNGWDYVLGGILPLFLIAVMCSHVLVSAFSPETKVPDLPVPWSQVHLGTGIAAAVLVFLRLVISSDVVGGLDVGDDLDRKVGLFLALIAAVVVAVGGFRRSQEGDAEAPPPPAAGGAGPAPF